jgi:glycosyltransferase involved in cell wall biosynthesis
MKVFFSRSQARAWERENFDSEIVAKQYIELYEEVLHG